MKFTAVCSNPDCKFSRTYGRDDTLGKFCPMCAKELLYNCPECNGPIQTRGAVHCEACGAPLKPAPTV